VTDRSKLFAATLLVASFLAGAAVGTAVSAARGEGDERGERQTRMRVSYTDRLDRELDLSPDQRTSVSAILDKRQTAMRAIWREVEPRFDSLRTQIRKEIMAVLDETQQEKFEQLIARSDSARAAREHRSSSERRESYEKK
jgi:Spy/CpxP family protein refolding chaperone